jgi:hypothetical protein
MHLLAAIIKATLLQYATWLRAMVQKKKLLESWQKKNAKFSNIPYHMALLDDTTVLHT